MPLFGFIRACVCGSDLWWYRIFKTRIGITSLDIPKQSVLLNPVGEAVTDIKAGDFVIVPFTHGCGHCAACLAYFDGDCTNQEGAAMVVTRKVNSPLYQC